MISPNIGFYALHEFSFNFKILSMNYFELHELRSFSYFEHEYCVMKPKNANVFRTSNMIFLYACDELKFLMIYECFR